MDKVAVLFTMKGCPYCVDLKEMLKKEDIPFFDRDIHENKEEYELFVEVTGNDYVPSFMLIENPDTEPVTELFAPDRDFKDINEGFEIIKSFVNG
jgi:glutaredoxin